MIDILKGGGAEKVLTDIVKNIDKNRLDITVLSVFDGGEYVSEIKKYVEYRYIFPKYKQDFLFRRIINRIRFEYAKFILRRLDPSVVYKMGVDKKYDYEVAFLEGYSSIVVAGSTNKKSKKIVWIHTNLLMNPWCENYFKRISQKEVYSKYDRILCVSEGVRKAFIEKYGVKDKVGLQYNPVDEKLILRKSKENGSYIEKRKKFLMVTLGRLDPQKGYSRLLRVVKKLKEDKYDFELWILGEGIERSNLENYITKNDMEDTVKLLGFKKNPYKYLSKGDLYVCSSITEGFSTVAMEASILGIPTITTDCDGMKEIFGNNEYGLITENNENNLYEGLKKILNNREVYLNYKEKIKERGSYFRLENRVKEIEELFEA